jgi:hypothetical protein
MERLLFLHIPKTAGTSLMTYFNVILGREAIYQQPGEILLLDNTERYQLIAGHFPIREVRELLRSRYSFTFLRDPIDLAVSRYHYYREITDPQVKAHDRDVELAQRMNFRECLATYAAKPWSVYGNVQTVFLSDRQVNAAAPAEMLNSAKRNLEALSFFGLHEEFDTSVALLLKNLRLPQPQHVPRVNKTRVRPPVEQLEQPVHDQLCEMNRLDIELYEFAKMLFRQRRDYGSRVSTRIFTESGHRRREDGSGDCLIQNVSLRSLRTRDLFSSDPAIVEVDVSVRRECEHIVAGISIIDEHGKTRYGTNTDLLGLKLPVQTGQTYRVSFSLNLLLPPGKYYLTVAAHDQNGRNYHWIENHVAFHIGFPAQRRFAGRDDCQARCSVEPLGPMDPVPESDRSKTSVRVLGSLQPVSLDHSANLEVLVENLSEQWLASRPPHPVQLSYHLLDPQTKKILVFDGIRTILRTALAPQSRSLQRITIDQKLKGRFILQPMLVQEGVAWFDHASGYEDVVIEI